MNAIDYILLGAVAVVITAIAAHLLRRKKQGKGGCGCGCSGCPSAGACGKKTEEKDDETV